MSAPWIGAFAALWGTVILLTLLVVGVLRRITGVLERAEARVLSPESLSLVDAALPGTRIPPFDLSNASGHVVPSEHGRGAAVLYLLMDSACGPCKRLARNLQQAGSEIDGRRLFLVLDDSEAGREFPVPSNVRVRFQANRVASEALGSSATPHAFLLDPDGVVVDVIVPRSLNDVRGLMLREEKGGGLSAVSQTNVAL